MMVFLVITSVDLQEDINITEKYTAFIIRGNNGSSVFLRNVCIYLHVHKTIQPRRPTSTEFHCLSTSEIEQVWGNRQCMYIASEIK
jgi:hypothetical protein